MILFNEKQQFPVRKREFVTDKHVEENPSASREESFLICDDC